jgi:hypothetical protein
MSDWDVPGYEVQELLGLGTTGEVWRAQERSSGQLVVLRRIAGGDRAAVTAVKAAAAVVRSLTTTHVVRLRTTTRAGRDDVLVLEHAAGGSIAELLLRRGRLAPLAEALGQAHSHDLVHGRLRATSVLLDAQGKPLLDGLVLGALLDPEDGFDPTGGLGAAADVWALGALAHLLLTGEDPGPTVLGNLAPRAPLPLVRAIESALAFDATTRPAAADLASALLTACPPLPLEGVVAHEEPPPRRRVRAVVVQPSRAVRRALIGSAAAVVAVAVVAVGWSWGRHVAEPAAQVSVALPEQEWRAVVEDLDGARAQAFAHADADLLDGVYATGTDATAADTKAIVALERLSRTALGVEHEVSEVTVVTATDDRVELRVRESLGPYQVLDGAGRVLEEHAAGPMAVHRLVLVSTSLGWRIEEVRAAA